MGDESQIPDLKRLIEVVIQKVDGLASDLRTNTYSIDRVEAKVDKLENRFDVLENRFVILQSDVGTIKTSLTTLTGQFTFVGKMAMDDNERLDSLEQRVDTLENNPH